MELRISKNFVDIVDSRIVLKIFALASCIVPIVG